MVLDLSGSPKGYRLKPKQLLYTTAQAESTGGHFLKGVAGNKSLI